MAKSLQDQLLAMGLADKNKAKKNNKEMKKQEHLKRTGQENDTDAKREKAEAARKEKAAKDRELNKQRDAEAHKKAIAAQIQQLVDTNLIEAQYGDRKSTRPVLFGRSAMPRQTAIAQIQASARIDRKKWNCQSPPVSAARRMKLSINPNKAIAETTRDAAIRLRLV